MPLIKKANVYRLYFSKAGNVEKSTNKLLNIFIYRTYNCLWISEFVWLASVCSDMAFLLDIDLLNKLINVATYNIVRIQEHRFWVVNKD